jgi:hypothetical protein
VDEDPRGEPDLEFPVSGLPENHTNLPKVVMDFRRWRGVSPSIRNLPKWKLSGGIELMSHYYDAYGPDQYGKLRSASIFVRCSLLATTLSRYENKSMKRSSTKLDYRLTQKKKRPILHAAPKRNFLLIITWEMALLGLKKRSTVWI